MRRFDVKPEIEAFDLSQFLRAKETADKGKILGPPHVQFAMGVKNAMTADRSVFDDQLHTVERRFGRDASWTPVPQALPGRVVGPMQRLRRRVQNWVSNQLLDLRRNLPVRLFEHIHQVFKGGACPRGHASRVREDCIDAQALWREGFQKTHQSARRQICGH